MPKLEYFLVAESVSVDQDTNSVSIFNVLEEIEAAELPVVVPKMVAISSWLVAEHEHDSDFQVTLRFSGGGFEEAEEHPFNMRRGKRARHRIFHWFKGVPFKKFGTVSFEVLLNGEHRASHTVVIEQEEESG